ncbi:hypothetical protein [Bacillus sp. B-jedd]|uniref:hypothetical protein n=1 Tax=Bacillus sp. B-jedd TaxID=1476857 RepID=UPI0011DC925F|nr:hypothetical protein [Bacillus sp. B-jedd]
MKKTLGLFLALFLSFGLAVSATSWVRLEPAEVVKRAKVAVVGKYDFSGKPVKGEGPLGEGYNFIVEKAYKGDDVAAILKVGIDMFDISWAKEFQQQGGTFLLFLEENNNKYLVPVGGPNGMIQMADGKVHEEDPVRREFYENYIKEREAAGKTVPVKPVKQEEAKGLMGFGPYLLPVTFILLAGGVAYFGTRKMLSKKS